MNAKKMLFAGVCLLAACFTQAQESQMPKAFSYQAVVRNSQGKVIAKQPVGIKVEIVQGSTEGTVVYAETQTPESSQTGTVNLLIGAGTTTQGVFADINWGAAIYFLRISMDLQGGSNHEVVSTTQMLPVPYALYAEKAGSVVNNGESTPETPSDGTIKYGRDFFIAPGGAVSSASKSLFDAMAGILNMDLDKYIYSNGHVIYSGIRWGFSLVYLTGTDLELTADIEGVLCRDDCCSSPSAGGRHYEFDFGKIDVSKLDGNNQYQTKLVVKDKNDDVVISFPFTVQYIIHETTLESPSPSEE